MSGKHVRKVPQKGKSHEGKKRFLTQEAANAALINTLKSMAAKGNPIATYMRVYGCSCGGYHIGRVRGRINWDVVSSYKPGDPVVKGNKKDKKQKAKPAADVPQLPTVDTGANHSAQDLAIST